MPDSVKRLVATRTRRWVWVVLLIVVLLLPAILALTWPKHRPEGTVVDTVGLVVVVHQ